MKTLIYTFGRMSPPTKGHQHHIEVMKAFAEGIGADVKVYLSQKQDANNPIDPTVKMGIVKQMAGNVEVGLAQNPFHIIDQMGKGYNRIVFATGGDHFEPGSPMATMFEPLKEYARNRGITLDVMSTGPRVEGISGTAARNAATNNDYTTYQQIAAPGTEEASFTATRNFQQQLTD